MGLSVASVYVKSLREVGESIIRGTVCGASMTTAAFILNHDFASV